MKTNFLKLFFVLAVFTIFSNAAHALGMQNAVEPTAVNIIALLTGGATYLATELAKKLLSWSGDIILFLVVPVLSLFLGWIVTKLDSSTSMWINAFIGLGAVFIDNLISRLKNG